MGIRRHSPGCPCADCTPPPCSGGICVTLKGCWGLPLGGVTITLESIDEGTDGHPADGRWSVECVTASNGQCCMGIDQAGYYRLTTPYGGFVTGVQEVILECNEVAERTITLETEEETYCSPCCPDSPVAGPATICVHRGTWLGAPLPDPGGEEGGGEITLTRDAGLGLYWGCYVSKGAYVSASWQVVDPTSTEEDPRCLTVSGYLYDPDADRPVLVVFDCQGLFFYWKASESGTWHVCSELHTGGFCSPDCGVGAGEFFGRVIPITGGCPGSIALDEGSDSTFPAFEGWSLQAARSGTVGCDDGDPMAYLDQNILDGSSLPNYQYLYTIDGSCV